MLTYETIYELDKIDDYVSVNVLYKKTKFGMEVTDIVLSEEFEYDGTVYEEGTSLFSCDLDSYADIDIYAFAEEIEEKLTDEYESRSHEASAYFYELNQEIAYSNL